MKPSKTKEINEKLEAQQGLVARRQLYDLGCTDGEIEWVRRDWRDVHAGVYVSGHAPLTNWQRWYAASLTERETYLARWSVAAMHGLRIDRADDPIHVVRPGSGGPRKTRKDAGFLDTVDIRYSLVLPGDTTTTSGIAATTLPRAMLDLSMLMDHAQRDRLFRDAIRLRRTDRAAIQALVDTHRGHRGVGRLKELLSRYSAIPIERTRSDAEVEGLVVLQAAGLALPQVNVEVAGYEGDFVDLDRKVILELDGKNTHQFPERDAERNAAWQAAGFIVQRRPTDDAYDQPDSVVRGMKGHDPDR